MINSADAATNEQPTLPLDTAPRCRCTPEQIERGHRRRCPAGPPTYVATGRWAGLTAEQIEGER